MTRIRVPLGKFIKEYSERNKGNEDIPVYSVTNSQGFCTEYFGKEVASQDKTTYKIVPQGYFAYNPSRINVGSVDWQRYEKRVIVSPLYNVFSVSEGIDRQYLYYFLRSDCENLFGEGEDKKEFVVFDYMRNFQFFDEHPKGREAGEVVAPVAARFIRMVQMIKCLQDANYVDVKYQNIRENLIDHVVDDVKAMGTERVEVRLELRYVERYKERKQYECLEEIHKEEIIDHLAKLVVSDEKDEAAISFDVLMYGLMLSVMTGGKNLGRLKRYVVGNANILLKECATIPDIKVRISELKELVSDHYWDVQDVLKFEETRKSLREIMKYIPAKKEKLHYSNFKDIVVFREEGRLTSLSASDFEDYRAKVNEYVEAHKTTPAINKLLHNEPISVEDYNELERIFTVELGTAEDYEMNYQDTPFGLLIRKIAKMDRTAAYAAFSTFILEERPNTEQLHFIEQVVDYVVENGYINNVLDLMKTPFDRPYKFSLIFTYEEQVKFVKIINNIKNNALVT